MRPIPSGFTFDVVTQTFTLHPSNEERIATVLAGIKADLERKLVTDPKVWSGYPWPDDVDDEDLPDVDVGLFEQLVRCARH